MGGALSLLATCLSLCSSSYMSTLPDSARVSCIFNKILQKSCIDNFSRRERSFPRIFTITSRREIALVKVVFHTFRQSVMLPRLVKGSDHRSRLSKHTLHNILIDCFDNLNWSNCSHELEPQGALIAHLSTMSTSVIS